jgi:hypothetical protein
LETISYDRSPTSHFPVGDLGESDSREKGMTQQPGELHTGWLGVAGRSDEGTTVGKGSSMDNDMNRMVGISIYMRSSIQVDLTCFGCVGNIFSRIQRAKPSGMPDTTNRLNTRVVSNYLAANVHHCWRYGIPRFRGRSVLANSRRRVIKHIAFVAIEL